MLTPVLTVGSRPENHAGFSLIEVVLVLVPRAGTLLGGWKTALYIQGGQLTWSGVPQSLCASPL